MSSLPNQWQLEWQLQQRIPSQTGIRAAVATPEQVTANQTTQQPYPNYRVIVLNDDFNTFEHVVNCLVRYIPGMVSDRAWQLADQVHHEGAATVWSGPLEQAELYHMQLCAEGLTMAPLEMA
ncbi:MAG: ATP-dependent Clp protease adapter ClpS [Synechococcales bacterium]|nr:ATP-dependent Clp protease adapter ClpS [Synechococcales bacterium]